MLGLQSKDLKVTPIVAYGLVFLCSVVMLVGLEKFWRYENAVAVQLVAAQDELATLNTLQNDTMWVDRFAQSQSARQAVLDGLWRGNTSGVIAAQLQQSLRKEAAALKYDRLRIQVNPEIADVGGIQVLSFEMRGRSPNGKNIVSFLEAIARNSQQIIVLDVDFTQDIRGRRAPTLAVSGVIPVQIVDIDTAPAILAGPSNVPSNVPQKGGNP